MYNLFGYLSPELMGPLAPPVEEVDIALADFKRAVVVSHPTSTRAFNKAGRVDHARDYENGMPFEIVGRVQTSKESLKTQQDLEAVIAEQGDEPTLLIVESGDGSALPVVQVAARQYEQGNPVAILKIPRVGMADNMGRLAWTKSSRSNPERQMKRGGIVLRHTIRSIVTNGHEVITDEHVPDNLSFGHWAEVTAELNDEVYREKSNRYGYPRKVLGGVAIGLRIAGRAEPFKIEHEDGETAEYDNLLIAINPYVAVAGKLRKGVHPDIFFGGTHSETTVGRKVDSARLLKGWISSRVIQKGEALNFRLNTATQYQRSGDPIWEKGQPLPAGSTVKIEHGDSFLLVSDRKAT